MSDLTATQASLSYDDWLQAVEDELGRPLDTDEEEGAAYFYTQGLSVSGMLTIVRTDEAPPDYEQL